MEIAYNYGNIDLLKVMTFILNRYLQISSVINTRRDNLVDLFSEMTSHFETELDFFQHKIYSNVKAKQDYLKIEKTIGELHKEIIVMEKNRDIFLKKLESYKIDFWNVRTFLEAREKVFSQKRPARIHLEKEIKKLRIILKNLSEKQHIDPKRVDEEVFIYENELHEFTIKYFIEEGKEFQWKEKIISQFYKGALFPHLKPPYVNLINEIKSLDIKLNKNKQILHFEEDKLKIFLKSLYKINPNYISTFLEKLYHETDKNKGNIDYYSFLNFFWNDIIGGTSHDNPLIKFLESDTENTKNIETALYYVYILDPIFFESLRKYSDKKSHSLYEKSNAEIIYQLESLCKKHSKVVSDFKNLILLLRLYHHISREIHNHIVTHPLVIKDLFAPNTQKATVLKNMLNNHLNPNYSEKFSLAIAYIDGFVAESDVMLTFSKQYGALYYQTLVKIVNLLKELSGHYSL